MAGQPNDERARQLAERLERATADARELLSDLHSVGKDLRRTGREIRELIATASTDFETDVATQLNELRETTEEMMTASAEKVFAEFEKLGAVLLGVDRAEPLESMVRKVAAMPGGRQVQRYETTVNYDADILAPGQEQP
jgi:hypothetical protein